jgi:hypothetical protein
MTELSEKCWDVGTRLLNTAHLAVDADMGAGRRDSGESVAKYSYLIHQLKVQKGDGLLTGAEADPLIAQTEANKRMCEELFEKAEEQSTGDSRHREEGQVRPCLRSNACWGEFNPEPSRPDLGSD